MESINSSSIVGIITIILRQSLVSYSITVDDFVSPEQGEAAQLEVRAVFINCEPDIIFDTSPDIETKRFQREELFKHGALQNCKKKLALTVKLASDTDNFSDDYIPIEHVVEGINKRRVRLLNPYVLRLRQQQPLEAYKLRKIDTVSGVLMEHKTASAKDNVSQLNSISDDSILSLRHLPDYHSDLAPLAEGNIEYHGTCLSCYRDFNDKYSNTKAGDFHSKAKQWPSNFKSNENRKYVSKKPNKNQGKEITGSAINKNDKSQQKCEDSSERHAKKSNSEILANNLDTTEKDFDFYDIGEPNLWYQINVQLFEKISTSDGRTVWNDITKDQSAFVSTISPEWTAREIAIRYRPTEWIRKDEFSLPMSSLCLLTPIHCNDDNAYETTRADANEEYIVVPIEDVVGVNDGKPLKNRGYNSSISSVAEVLAEDKQGHRKVEIRLSRALNSGVTKNIKIESKGEGKYLTIRHRQPLRAQIDLEARADQNQLVRDGSSGRITTVVADSTKETQTILSLQATNTGLVASRYRAVARNCIPEISSLIKNNDDKSIYISDPVVIPPMHNKHFQFELPIKLTCDVINCSVALLNNENESVAVRDIKIKRGDRCFCVWHCDCICLSDDSKLTCREMSEARQVAAGLTTRDRRRRARSVCYQDAIPVNLFVIFVGVFMALLFLGFVKGIVGLFMPCIAAWGIDRLIQIPRKLNHYYESSLRSQEVQYDQDGWPVHPETKKRTVRLVSRPMEFVLNLIFFVCAPCFIMCDAYKQTLARFKNTDVAKFIKSNNDDTETNKCFSSHDMQNLEPRLRHRRRTVLHKWMMPDAEQLSTDLWRKGLYPKQDIEYEFARPLLHDNTRRGDGVCKSEDVPDTFLDSEQDDTEYILMQMQKSRESLARSQKRLSISGLESVKIHGDI